MKQKKIYKLYQPKNKQFINKIIKRDIIMYTILVISLIFLTTTSSYAYFTLTKEATMENIVSANVEGIEVNNTSIEVSDLYPTSEEEATGAMNSGCKDSSGNNICFTYDFTITNNSYTTRHLLYYLTPIENTFSNLKFKVFDSSDTLTMGKTSIPKKNNKIGLTNMTKKISPSVTLTYTLLFWIDEQSVDQTIYDASRSFSGQLSIELLTTGEYDDTSPVMSTISLTEDSRTFNDGNLSNFTISWSSLDDDISKYVVKVYDSDNNLKITDEITDTTINSKTYKGLDYDMLPGDYYAQVYGVDNYNNSGELYCSETSSSYCKTSAVTTLKYPLLYQISSSNTGTTISNVSQAYYGGTVTFTVAANTNYTLNTWSIDEVNTDGSNGNNIDSGTSAVTNYTTTNVLYNDFRITTTASSCVAEGTKILLANGKYKNVEDIDYNDLLVVMDYQNGGITYQYPLWLEKESISDNYIKITFSDNSYIDIVGDHAFFSYDDNLFVTVSDKEKFHVGTRVAKLVDNKLEEVSVKSIETINETVRYYIITTTRYYNFIANDLVTNDDAVEFTNLYGFNSDITFRDPIATDLYTDEELAFLPKYLAKGLRAAEGKYLIDKGVDYDTFVYYLESNNLNEEIWDKPKLNENGKREWMVTTSEDEVTEENKLSYLMEEGDYYTLKTPKTINGKKFIGWFHTGENIIYQPGDKVEVLYGTHFIAKYQDLFDNNYQFGVKR